MIEPCDVTLPAQCYCWITDEGKMFLVCSAASWNDISVFSPNWSTINTISIQNANIGVLDTMVLGHVAVEEVHLPDNQIVFIEDTAFTSKQVTSMTLLDLRNNHLMGMPVVINRLTSLETLSLANNEIATVEARFLINVTNLLELNLGGNLLCYGDDIMSGSEVYQDDELLPNLQKFVLSFDSAHRDGAALRPGTMMSRLRDNLVTWAIRDTNLQSVRIGRGFKNLLYLYLEGNNITLEKLTTDSFREVEGQLSTLKLNRNLLTGVPYHCLRNMSLLQSLDLSNNRITKITTFPQLSHLIYLLLKANFIFDISDDAFSRLPALRFLDLSDNNLFTFTPRLFTDAQWRGMIELLLGQNPLTCDCRNQCLIDKMQRAATAPGGARPFTLTDMARGICGGHPLLLEIDLDALACCRPDDQCCG